MLQPAHSESIWLPDGSVRTVRELQADRAIKEYDASLSLGRNKQNGEWVVLADNIAGGLFPVLGLGFELPSPEEIKKRLYRADTKRHGGKIVQRVARHNEAIQRETNRKASEAARETAEVMAWGHLKLSGRHTERIFVPKQVT